MNQMVGVFRVKNEEYCIAWSLMIVPKCCDHIIVLDSLSKQTEWDTSEFRCWHWCFLKQSSQDNSNLSPNQLSALKVPGRIKNASTIYQEDGTAQSKQFGLTIKRRKNCRIFGSVRNWQPGESASVDTECDEVMAYLPDVRVVI